MSLSVVIGEDDLLVQSTAKKTFGDLVPETIDSILSTNADLQLADLARVKESIWTDDMFSPVKATWWKNVHFLPGARRAAAEDVKLALERFASALAKNPLSENHTLVITGPSLLRTSLFAKTMSTACEIIFFETPKGAKGRAAVVARAIDAAAERNLTFAPGAAELFVSRVGLDTRSILSELDKMACYLVGADVPSGPLTVTREDVMAISSPGAGVEPEVWAITDAVGARDAARACRAILAFRDDPGFGVLVSSVIEKYLRQLLAFDEKKASRNWFDQKLAAARTRYLPKELRYYRFRFMKLRERLVSGGESAEELIITETMRMCRRR